MKIIVNDIAASSGGALSILKSFYNYILENDKENEYVFLLSKNYIKETKNIKVVILDNVKRSWFKRLKFDLFEGKKKISLFKPDIVFSLQNTMVFGLNVPQVIYMHQSLPFQKDKKFSFFKYEERKLAMYQQVIGVIIKLSLKKANKVIVQTKWIKDAIIDSINLESDKIIIIPPNSENFSKYIIDGIFNKEHFFYPAADIIYKNHECIYIANELLVKKGIRNHFIELTIDGKSKGNINKIGEIPLDSVIKRYNKSTLIFPSYIETAGLPLIEARQLGSIILVSDCLFSREVLNGYENAYYFDPFNPKELAVLMEKVMSGKIERKTVKNNIHVEENGWEKTIKVLISFKKTIYKERDVICEKH